MGFSERRQLVEKRMGAMGAGQSLSLARYSLFKLIHSAIVRFVRGATLDIGAGLSPYDAILESVADRVTIVDIEDRSGRVDRIGDIQDMPEVPAGSFDSILCTQVLEHVPRPRRAMDELARVLRPGGYLVVSVPHLSAIHEAPSDYFRYTEYGLRELAEGAGLEVVEILPTGGLVSFVAHGMSVALMTSIGSLPGLFHPVRLFNVALLVRLAGPIDRWLGMPRRYPCDYVLVAHKRVVT
jgi:SAM-dependent methyltransferase